MANGNGASRRWFLGEILGGASLLGILGAGIAIGQSSERLDEHVEASAHEDAERRIDKTESDIQVIATKVDAAESVAAKTETAVKANASAISEVQKQQAVARSILQRIDRNTRNR